MISSHVWSVVLRRCVWLALVVIAVPACSDASSEPAPEAESAEEPDLPATGRVQEPTDLPMPFVAEPRIPCRHDGLEDAAHVTVTGADSSELSFRVAQRTHRCAHLAVVAPTDSWAASLAVPVALSLDAPLLLMAPGDPASILGYLDDLDVRSLVTVGVELDGLERPGTALVVPPEDPGDEAMGSEGGGPEPTIDDAGRPDADGTDDATGGDPAAGTAEEEATAEEEEEEAEAAAEEAAADHDVELALIVAEHLEVDRFIALREDDVRGRTAAALQTDGSAALLPVPVDNGRVARLAEVLVTTARLEVVGGSSGQDLTDELLSVGIDAELIDGERWPDGGATSWLVDPDQPDAGALAVVAAGGRDEAVLPVDASDLRAGASLVARIRAAEPERVVLVGDVTSDADWQLTTVLNGPTLPGGGLLLFDNERLVALYGSPVHSALGALGEQDLDATVERLQDVAAPYDADGMQVLPTLEIIATVASTAPGDQGDYSARTDLEVLRPYVDRAAEEGFYVVLDLQPGRTDFLEQAQEYEELLREPHVGLALDPEWRLAPDEVHLQQIGSVEVEEVQRVADWLAELTREHQLPQKLLLLHQFTFGMLPDRDELVAPPELAVVVHMDGQGALSTKYDTYAAITQGAEDLWTWGWKNFYDEDSPVATPEQVLDLQPVPMLVTYQ